MRKPVLGFVTSAQLQKIAKSTGILDILTIGIILIGYSTVFCKIWDFICTSLHSAETILDELDRPIWFQTSANKTQYFTKHCRTTF